MKRALAGLMVTLLILSGCSGRRPENLGTRSGRLAPCPDKPNCVSTEGPYPERILPPLPFVGNRDQSRTRILEILRGMARSEIVEVNEAYVYVRFRTRFFRFVDDVEFLFDDNTKLVHFRSASRVGYYDFGLNRRRMIEISKAYLEK